MSRRFVAVIVVALASDGCNGSVAAESDATDAGEEDQASPDASAGETRADATIDDGPTKDTAPYCTDYGHDLGATLTLTCDGPLSESADFDVPPITGWCIGANGFGYRTSSCECGGMLAIYIGDGTDCYREYLFDATTRKLVARLEGCLATGFRCAEGPSTLVLPESSCFGTPSGIFDMVQHDWPPDAGCP